MIQMGARVSPPNAGIRAIACRPLAEWSENPYHVHSLRRADQSICLDVGRACRQSTLNPCEIIAFFSVTDRKENASRVSWGDPAFFTGGFRAMDAFRVGRDRVRPASGVGVRGIHHRGTEREIELSGKSATAALFIGPWRVDFRSCSPDSLPSSVPPW